MAMPLMLEMIVLYRAAAVGIYYAIKSMTSVVSIRQIMTQAITVRFK